MRIVSMFLMVLAATACSPYKQYTPDSYRKDFSPLLYPYGHSIPAQWEGKDWDPSAWPLSYQNKETFTKGLFDADILRAQYIEKDTVPVVVVGPNFYHLSDHDQARICKTLDMLYGATTGKYGSFVLKDWYSNAIIGEFTKNGLTLR